jgi:hypothetical protein
MNAPDSLPPDPRSLSASTLSRLRSVIEQRAADPKGQDGALREALRAAAEEARELALRPEELIIALKTLLDDLTLARPGWDPLDQLHFREWVVTTSIRAYYGRFD